MVDPSRTPEDCKKHERLQSYRIGWRHGARAGARDKRFEEHSREDLNLEYRRGYEHGFNAMCIAGMQAAERLGYDPRMSILRSAPDPNPPNPPGLEDVPELFRCDESMPGQPKVRCSLITEGHGPEHKRITPTGRATHKWPCLQVCEVQK